MNNCQRTELIGLTIAGGGAATSGAGKAMAAWGGLATIEGGGEGAAPGLAVSAVGDGMMTYGTFVGSAGAVAEKVGVCN